MDKRKIVFIVDDGLPSGGLYDALKAMGDQLHVEVEMMEYKDILQGTNPKMVIWDEGPLPVPERMLDIDFSELETRICGMYDTLPKTPDRGTVTGRLSHPEPAVLPGMYGLPYRRFGKSMLQQDIYAMLVEGINKADRNIAKALVEPGYRGASKLPWYASYGREPIKPADHPSRKREPKGPRGQWGKLK